MSEVSGLTGEQVNRLVLFREIEQLLDSGFVGTIELNCPGDGTVHKVKLSEYWKPGEQRRTLERRTAGPREGEDRRKG